VRLVFETAIKSRYYGFPVSFSSPCTIDFQVQIIEPLFDFPYWDQRLILGMINRAVPLVQYSREQCFSSGRFLTLSRFAVIKDTDRGFYRSIGDFEHDEGLL